MSADPRAASVVPRVLPTLLPGAPSWETVFAGARPLEVELGFGRPHFLFERARERSDRAVVGIEWKRRWVEAAWTRAARLHVENVRAIHGNAWLLLGALFGPESVTGITLNFPDPWWKAKHEKRRIINEPFAHVLLTRLRPGGFVFVQTDVASLLERMLEALESSGLENAAGPGRVVPKKPMTASSHREKKCRESGVPVFRALLFRPPTVGSARAEV